MFSQRRRRALADGRHDLDDAILDRPRAAFNSIVGVRRGEQIKMSYLTIRR